MFRNGFVFALLGSVFSIGCTQGESTPVSLDWNQGDSWHVSARYRVANVRTESPSVDLEFSEMPEFGELWSNEVIWKYQVVESNYVPTDTDELYPYAVSGSGEVKSLAVVRAYLDLSVTEGDSELAEADPVIYLVFREDRDRLAAIISFTNVDGDRLEQAWSSKELGRSWSTLSQSMLTALPTYLAPHGVRTETGERLLETGATVGTTKVSDDAVDVFYDDAMSGDVVLSRYEDGEPWPTWTVAENVEANLLSKETVTLLRRARGVHFSPEPPENYDYRAALASSVDVDSAFRLNFDDLGTQVEVGAPEGFQPWNGSWWPQSESALVFGYNDRQTISDRLREGADPTRKAMDALNQSLQDMEKGTDEYSTTLDEYYEKQGEFIDQLVEFYNGVLADLDGGSLTVQEGELRHSDGWSYDLDELSPMDKAALSMYYQGMTNPNPFFVPAWELLNHYSPDGGSWWGHCNGWSGAAILMHEPVDSIMTQINGEDVEYTTADLKGLLSETHYSTYSRFYGARYYGEENDDIIDLFPPAFHRLITFYLRDQQVPLVFDTDSGEQVWNFPAYAADIHMTETTVESDVEWVNVNTADGKALDTLPGIGVVLGARIVDYRETYGPFQSLDDLMYVYGIGYGTVSGLEGWATVTPVERTFDVVSTVYFATDGVDETHVDNGTPEEDGFTKTYQYTLVTDADGMILRGTWDDDKEHPDFAWIPYTNPTSASFDRSNENPYLSQQSLNTIIGTGLERR